MKRKSNQATHDELQFAELHLSRGYHLTTRQLAVLSAPAPLERCPSDRSISNRLAAAGVEPVYAGTRSGPSRWPAEALVHLGIMPPAALEELTA